MAAVIGVDLGSSSARAIAIDETGRVLASATARYPGAERWPEGRADASAWLHAVAYVVREVGTQDPEAARPRAVSIGGQSPSVVADAVPHAVTVRHPAGATLSPRDQHLAQAEVLAGEGGLVCSQGYDWVARQFGARDVQSRWIGDDAIPGFGDLQRTGSVIGTSNGAHGLPAGASIAAGGQDAFLAFWAGGLTRVDLAMDPGGRTGGLVATAPALQLDADAFRIASPNRDIAIVGGPVNAHGLSIEWLRDLTARPVEWLLGVAEGVPPGAGGVVFAPYLEGERAPRWNRDVRGGLSGLASGTGPAQLTRAVLEGTAYGLRHILDGIRAQGISPEVLICTGSPSRSRLWCSIKASILGLPVLVPDEPDLAALGSAYSAGAAAGWWPRPGESDEPDAWPEREMTRIEPEPLAVYEDGYRRFLELGDFAETQAVVAATTTRT